MCLNQTISESNDLPTYGYRLEMTTNLRRKGPKMKFMVAWEVAGALVKPKGITKTSY